MGIFSGNAFVNKDGEPMLCWFGVESGVCVATAEDNDLIRWKKHPKNPIIPSDHSSAILVHDGRQHRLYTMHPDVRVYFPEVSEKR